MPAMHHSSETDLQRTPDNNSYGLARSTVRGSPLEPEMLHNVDSYWRASLYLCLGMLYLKANPLLREPLELEHIKPRLLGHWGSDAGQCFTYIHFNRLINKYGLNAIYVSGPGHGAPAVLSQAYLEGTYSEVYPDKGEDAAGMQRFFRQFSFPGGIGSHATPETPGSLHEGGELGYSVSHAFGTVFDRPDLITLVMVGDGESETGPLATSWHSNKFLNPARDGAVLPILHLNGYKIANPTILARIPREELEWLFRGYGWTPHFVEGDDPQVLHHTMAATLEQCIQQIRAIQHDARTTGKLAGGASGWPRWPMIVLRTPKGWTGPKEVDGHKVEGFWRAHQIPLPDVASNSEHLQILESWLRGYHPEKHFDESGRLIPELKALAPQGPRRMSANPVANGGLLRKALLLPDIADYAAEVARPGGVYAENTRPLGKFLRDVMRDNMHNFRVFSPDENTSNRLDNIYEVSKKTWMADYLPEDANGGELAQGGRVMEMLSEHQCEGWLEGYLLTGRHGLFNCYEAFVHIVDSMFNQHAKWLKTTRQIPWRRPIASLNYLLSSHVWRQDHNGFSHQDPGFIDHVVNKKAGIIRVYLPPDANCLLSVADHCLRSRDYVNVIVAGKQPEPTWLTMDEAVDHCTRGLGIWEWASTDAGSTPDVVMACCGDVPTIETLAAVQLLRRHLPELKVRVVNVVDLMRLQPDTEHPHGLPDTEFDALFTRDRPVIFAYHGYPWLIHRLTYRRTGHAHLHVRGYKEEGTTTTPFDMVMRNDLDRFHLVMDVIDRVPGLASRAGHVRQAMVDRRLECRAYAYRFGEDPREISEWSWTG